MTCPLKAVPFQLSSSQLHFKGLGKMSQMSISLCFFSTWLEAAGLPWGLRAGDALLLTRAREACGKSSPARVPAV